MQDKRADKILAILTTTGKVLGILPDNCDIVGWANGNLQELSDISEHNTFFDELAFLSTTDTSIRVPIKSNFKWTERGELFFRFAHAYQEWKGFKKKHREEAFNKPAMLGLLKDNHIILKDGSARIDGTPVYGYFINYNLLTNALQKCINTQLPKD